MAGSRSSPTTWTAPGELRVLGGDGILVIEPGDVEGAAGAVEHLLDTGATPQGHRRHPGGRADAVVVGHRALMVDALVS